LTADPKSELARIADFLALKTTPQLLSQAVERSSADRLRALERTQGDQWVSTKGRREDIPFFGPGRRDRWKSELDDDSVAQIESAWGRLMKGLGYELVRTECEALTPPYLLKASLEALE
jgi:Sulfotransferase domain